MNIRQSFLILFRNKTYSLLNIAGLSVGIACAALILLWVEDEVTFDKFPKSENLYVLFSNRTHQGNVSTGRATSLLAAGVLKDEFAGVMRASRVMQAPRDWEHSENVFREDDAFVDSTFFSMIDLKFIDGNKETAFDNMFSVVISKSMAEKLFGNENPVGQNITIGDSFAPLIITGVFIDIWKNSSFNFDWMVPLEIYGHQLRIFQGINIYQWDMKYIKTLVELESNANPATVDDRIQAMYSQTPGIISGDGTLFLYPHNRMHLYGNFADGKETGKGYITTVRTITIIALIILLVACINFMNLATARSQKRTLEVGVRKTFGGNRLKLIIQFMAESALITFLAMALAILIVVITLPLYNMLIDKQLAINFGKLAHWGGLLGVGVICCLLAGSYPAFYLSSFPSIDMLKRMKTKNSGELWFRKGLVVFQFSASLVLIICTLFIYLQLQHVKNRPLGMDFDRVLNMYAPISIRQDFATFKNALVATGAVSDVTLAGHSMLQIGEQKGVITWSGKPEDFNPLIRFSEVGSGIVSTLGLELIEGRDFEDTHPFIHAIINETLAEMMGDAGRIGNHITSCVVFAQPRSEIIGIVKDFVYNDMYSVKQEPLLLLYHPQGANQIFMRLQTDVTQATLAKIGEMLEKFSPHLPFSYQFMDEQFNRLFYKEQFSAKLSLLFTALAIFISCLGLFGLTSFSAEQRTREIGIRKVLGASVWSIIQLLGRNFLFLLLISFVIAIPVSWYILNNYWLNDFSYRIDTSWTVFAGACLLVTFIAMFTVCSIALKAAMSDPVKAIKSE